MFTGTRLSLIVNNKALRRRLLGHLHSLGGARAPSSAIRVPIVGARREAWPKRDNRQAMLSCTALKYSFDFNSPLNESMLSLKPTCFGYQWILAIYTKNWSNRMKKKTENEKQKSSQTMHTILPFQKHFKRSISLHLLNLYATSRHTAYKPMYRNN